MCNKIIGLIGRLSISLPRKALFTAYKSFVRPHLDYGDILYEKPDNQNFDNKLEKVQYKACFAITGAIQGTSRQRFYDELGLMLFRRRRWYNKLNFFYKIVNGRLPNYIQSHIEVPSQDNYPLESVSAGKLKNEKALKKLFFFWVDEWNKLNPGVRNAKSIYKVKKSMKNLKVLYIKPLILLQ